MKSVAIYVSNVYARLCRRIICVNVMQRYICSAGSGWEKDRGVSLICGGEGKSGRKKINRSITHEREEKQRDRRKDEEKQKNNLHSQICNAQFIYLIMHILLFPVLFSLHQKSRQLLDLFPSGLPCNK